MNVVSPQGGDGPDKSRLSDYSCVEWDFGRAGLEDPAGRSYAATRR
jgi:hypothetical protein